MIKNEKEYAVAKAELRAFIADFAEFDVVGEEVLGVDPVIARAQRDSFARKIDDLRTDIQAYERLVAGVITDLPVADLGSLGKALIGARLSKGLSQRALAEACGLKEQQIQRYEKDSYSTANVRRLSLVADALGVSFSGSLRSESRDDNVDGPLRGFTADNFPFSEMKKRGWFGSKVSRLARVDSDQKRSVLIEFLSACPMPSGVALHRKTNSFVSAERQAGLLAWQGRVLAKAGEVANKYPAFRPLDSDVLNSLAKLSSEKDGIARLLDVLRAHGVIVVFEEHLPKTKVDGAALSLGGKWAVIGMSIRFDRVDNFWFVMLHEIGHLVRHWPQVKSAGIVDEDAGRETIELMEREADEFAENAILPSAVWKSSMVRFSKDVEQVKNFAMRCGLHPALVAGRIRRERGYLEFSELVNGSKVKRDLIRMNLLGGSK